jgi:hypothetical protein
VVMDSGLLASLGPGMTRPHQSRRNPFTISPARGAQSVELNQLHARLL